MIIICTKVLRALCIRERNRNRVCKAVNLEKQKKFCIHEDFDVNNKGMNYIYDESTGYSDIIKDTP